MIRLSDLILQFTGFAIYRFCDAQVTKAESARAGRRMRRSHIQVSPEEIDGTAALKIKKNQEKSRKIKSTSQSSVVELSACVECDGDNVIFK